MLDSDIQKAVEELDVTMVELNFLWTIFYENEPSITRLAALTFLDPSTVTQVIARLKKKKLVEISKKEHDQRYSYVKLSSKGDEIRKKSIVFNNKNIIGFFHLKVNTKEEKEKAKAAFDFLRDINLHFHGTEYVQWTDTLREKLQKDFLDHK
ncbi:MarR family winged helix-turn-helix transcriptional regulator [Bacillus salacetis]|uniref:MarR family winged helix-turn-helix transcriptional regulator n=1 Tax=Bacillus salacetis TaxID=2315464 RepID=UPI003BA3666F